MKFSNIALLLAGASAQTPSYLLGRWRGYNIKYGKAGEFFPGESGILFDQNTLTSYGQMNEELFKANVVQGSDGKIYIENEHVKKEWVIEEIPGVHFHSTSLYGFAMAGDGPVPGSFKDAMLDDTSIASFMWKCRPDVHDNICDFSTVKPPSMFTVP